jgi:hypothetical protein
MKQVSRDKWLRDVDARQRNIVFPDTAQNEARFWRNIISGQQRLTIGQTLGIAIMWLMMAFPLWALLKWMRYSVIAWLVVGLCVGTILLLRWRAFKAVSQIEQSKRKRFPFGHNE